MNERRFLIRIDGCPEPEDEQELLELVLAAASLELDLVVCLHGLAVHLLTEAGHSAWAQLVEQDLARVAVSTARAGLDGVLPDRVESLSDIEMTHLEHTSIVIQA